MDVKVGLWRKLSAEEWMLLKCAFVEDSWESLGLQGDPTSPFWKRSALAFFWKEWYWSWTPVLWPPHAKIWLIGKDSDAGRDWGQEEKGTTEDEMAGWHHWFNGHESEWTPGVGDGQGDLACCDSWGRKESDTTELLNWTVEISRADIYAPCPPSHGVAESDTTELLSLQIVICKLFEVWSSILKIIRYIFSSFFKCVLSVCSLKPYLFYLSFIRIQGFQLK